MGSGERRGGHGRRAGGGIGHHRRHHHHHIGHHRPHGIHHHHFHGHHHHGFIFGRRRMLWRRSRRHHNSGGGGLAVAIGTPTAYNVHPVAQVLRLVIVLGIVFVFMGIIMAMTGLLNSISATMIAGFVLLGIGVCALIIGLVIACRPIEDPNENVTLEEGQAPSVPQADVNITGGQQQMSFPMANPVHPQPQMYFPPVNPTHANPGDPGVPVNSGVPYPHSSFPGMPTPPSTDNTGYNNAASYLQVKPVAHPSDDQPPSYEDATS